MKRLICEAGATKADWRLIEDGRQTAQACSGGTNVSTMEMDAVAAVIREAAGALASGPVDAVHFYTAGVITDSIRSGLEDVLRGSFGAGEIEIQTDLVASARAACGHGPGIAAILGTGSNSCQYDGEKIVRQVRTGGFILGDEGSASALGRLFIADYIKGLVPDGIATDYARRFPSDYAEIVGLVYHNPASPSAWLGSLCPFIVSHYDHPYVKGLVDGNFRAFVQRCLSQYDLEKYPVGIIGGFANALQHIIRPIFEEAGVRIRAFIPSPVEELIKYHC